MITEAEHSLVLKMLEVHPNLVLKMTEAEQ
jgi:hypothetical protein